MLESLNLELKILQNKSFQKTKNQLTKSSITIIVLTLQQKIT